MLPPDAKPSEAEQSVSRFPLRNKLLAFAFALVVIPGTLLGALATRNASAALEAQVGRALAREAAHTADQLAARLRSERQTLASFARQDLMRDLRVGDVDKRVSLALATLRAGAGAARSYYALDAHGRVVAASEPRALGEAPPWLRELGVDAALGERTLGPLRAPEGVQLVMIAPLPDPDDPARVLGVLAGAFAWDALVTATRVVQRDLAQQGIAVHVLVCDARGEVLGGVRMQDRAGPARAELAAAAELTGAPGWLAQSETISGRAALASDLPPWRIVVMQSREDALAPVTSLQRRMALTLGALLLAALALAWLASRRVAQPLAELTRAIRGLARGGAHSVLVRGDDELGVLADSFNRMSADLTRAQSELVEAEKFSFVGELAAGVAHEIRTSLGVLKSSVQLLDRSLPADAREESHELAQMIRDEVGRLGGVVDDLLTLKPDRTLRLEPGPLAPILARAVEFARAPASAKGVRLAFEAPAHEAHVARAGAAASGRGEPARERGASARRRRRDRSLDPARARGLRRLRSARRRSRHSRRDSRTHLPAIRHGPRRRRRTRPHLREARRARAPRAHRARFGAGRDARTRRDPARGGHAVKRVIIVDDDRRTRRVLQILVERLGLASAAFEEAESALAALAEESAALVLTDLRMPGLDGLGFMRRLRTLDTQVPVIVLTAYGNVEAAVEAMKLGAVDFLAKPFDVDALELFIQRSLEHSRTRVEHRFLREQAARAPGFEELLGAAPAMQRVFEHIDKFAPAKSAVLITGETGTGKELVARAIHRRSPRADKLFVPLNCAAIPGELLESELFGHVRGAFTGATADREGKFAAADGGTLFLDEIGDMDLRLQAKLLRALQEGVVEPVGSNRRVRVDVRVVSSTNRDLEAAIKSGAFREDLYYRLNVLRIELPPLRERASDVPALAASFLAEFGRELGKGALALEPAAADALRAHRWPGNVRELRNLMERAAVLAERGALGEALVRELLPRPSGAASEAEPTTLELDAVVSETERRAILRALAAAHDNKLEAARLLGIGERTLWTKLKKYGL